MQAEGGPRTGSLTPCASPVGAGPCMSCCGYSHTWGPLHPGVSPSLEPTESPSKWKLVEKLRRMRQQGGPWKGGKEGIRVQTGAQPSPHLNLSTQPGWGLHSDNWSPGFSLSCASDWLCGPSLMPSLSGPLFPNLHNSRVQVN